MCARPASAAAAAAAAAALPPSAFLSRRLPRGARQHSSLCHMTIPATNASLSCFLAGKKAAEVGSGGRRGGGAQRQAAPGGSGDGDTQCCVMLERSHCCAHCANVGRRSCAGAASVREVVRSAVFTLALRMQKRWPLRGNGGNQRKQQPPLVSGRQPPPGRSSSPAQPQPRLPHLRPPPCLGS